MPEPAARTSVVLVGLMGSGKTTVGKKVARMLEVPFSDCDVELEARSGRTVADWFAEDGEDAFRAAEVALLDDLLAEGPARVIGAGGGLVVSEAARRRLQRDDVVVVYLHGDPAFLGSRAKAKPHRPALADQDPVAVLQAMYEVRDRWYREVADAVVEVRPAHEAGEKAKWRLAEQVVDALVELGAADRAALADAPARS